MQKTDLLTVSQVAKIIGFTSRRVEIDVQRKGSMLHARAIGAYPGALLELHRGRVSEKVRFRRGDIQEIKQFMDEMAGRVDGGIPQ